jgi:hypothetical protein
MPAPNRLAAALPPLPVPVIRACPPRIEAPGRRWAAPDASGSGSITVHRDTLIQVARTMHDDAASLGTVSGEVKTAGDRLGLLAMPPACTGLMADIAGACHGFASASTWTARTQAATARMLAESALVYEQAGPHPGASAERIASIRGCGCGDMVTGIPGTGREPGDLWPSSTPAGQHSTPPHPVTGRWYRIRSCPVAPPHLDSMDSGQVMDLLRDLDGTEFKAAYGALLSLARALDETTDRLQANAMTLALNWAGSAAQAAMGKFQEIHDETAQLAAQARHAAEVLQWVGEDLIPEYKSLPDPDATVKTGNGRQAGTLARIYLNSFTAHLIQAGNALPAALGRNTTGLGRAEPLRAARELLPPGQPALSGPPRTADDDDIREMMGRRDPRQIPAERPGQSRTDNARFDDPLAVDRALVAVWTAS